MNEFWRSFKEKFTRQSLFAPVHGQSLAVFRIIYGLTLVLDTAAQLFRPGYITQYFIQPPFHATYTGFQWVKSWPELWMGQLHFAVMLICALCVTAGFFYRTTLIIFTILFSYVFLIDEALYVNFHYLVIIFCMLGFFLPLNRVSSLDRRRHKEWNDSVPAWSLWALRLQTEILLLYAGIVKINSDWLHLEPLSSYLRRTPINAISGGLFEQGWVVALGAYGVIALHLLGSPLLFFKRTRLWVFLAYCCFHASNSFNFNVGIFPYMTLAATLCFFDPEWPRQVCLNIRNLFRKEKTPFVPTPLGPVQDPENIWILWIVGVWMVFHILFPLRPYMYPGDAVWTGEGQYFSWRMMLGDRRPYAFACLVRDPDSGQQLQIDPQEYLNPRQYFVMTSSPHMIWQFAHYIHDKWGKAGRGDVQVFCQSVVGLNGRKPAPLIDHTVDLAHEPWTLRHTPWILPLKEPLPERGRITAGPQSFPVKP